MATDSSAAASPAIVATACRDKVRLRFRKDGSLRLLSHHDLLRTFERLLRRAELPVRRTQGFHPHPRIVFALSLPLGVIGRSEVVEIELNEQLPEDDLLTRLRAQTPPGLTILELRRIDPRTTARVRGLCYGLPVPAARAEELRVRLREVLAAGSCVVERDRPTRRQLDIRPFLRDLPLREDGLFLEMDLALTPAGTARPDEVLTVLGLRDLLDSGVVLERLWLDLEDEPRPGAGP